MRTDSGDIESESQSTGFSLHKRTYFAKVKEIFASSNKLSSFTGVETFGENSVERLDVSGNYIALEDLMEDKGGLKALERLRSLKEISLVRNPGFEYEDENDSNVAILNSLRDKLREMFPELNVIDGNAFASRDGRV